MKERANKRPPAPRQAGGVITRGVFVAAIRRGIRNNRPLLATVYFVEASGSSPSDRMGLANGEEAELGSRDCGRVRSSPWVVVQGEGRALSRPCSGVVSPVG